MAAAGAYARLMETNVDLGNVWQDETGTAGITIQNTSAWASAQWHLQGLPAPLASRHSETLQGADLLKLDDDTNKAPPAEARGSLEGTAQSAELAWLQLAATSGTLAPGASTTVQVRLQKSTLPFESSGESA